MKAKDKLTAKQSAFVAKLLTDPERNATKAAISVGCPKKSAHITAHKWLKLAKVQAELAKRTEKVAKKLELTAEKVLREMARCGFVDPRKFFLPSGALKEITELDDDSAAAVASIEVDEIWEGSGESRRVIGYTKKLKFWSKTESLKMLGQHFALLTNKVEMSGPYGGPVEVQRMSDAELEAELEVLKKSNGEED